MQIDRILGNVGVLYVGAYNSSTQYEYLNCVTYNGSSYVCVNQNGVTGVTPGTTNDWQLSAQKGDTGGQGIQGEQGIQGATGNGIQSIEKTSSNALTDTYTILFTDGSSTTFEVENGKGIVSIEKTSSDGNVDTYTITYNDDTTSTFTVTNGEVTKEQLENERKISDNKYARALKTQVTDVESTQIYAENDVVNDLVINGAELTQKTREGYNFLPNKFESQTINGVAFTVQEDKSILANGTATGNIVINLLDGVVGSNHLGSNIIEIPSTITNAILSGCPAGGSGSTYKMDMWAENGNNVGNGNDYGNGLKINFTSNENWRRIKRARIVIYSGTTANNLVFKPMLVAGTEEKPYEQYGASPSLDFPSEVQVASEQNITINETNITIPLVNSAIGQYTDTIDRENNVQNKVIQELTLTGSESDWSREDTSVGTRFFKPLQNSIISNTNNPYALCTHFKLSYSDGTYNVVGNLFAIYNVSSTNRIGFGSFTDMSTVEEWKAKLQELYQAGTPVKIYYVAQSQTTNPLPQEIQTALSNFKLYQDFNNVSIDGGSMSFIYNKSLIYTINQLTQLVQTLSSEVQALQTPTTEPTVETTSEVQADG